MNGAAPNVVKAGPRGALAGFLLVLTRPPSKPEPVKAGHRLVSRSYGLGRHGSSPGAA